MLFFVTDSPTIVRDMAVFAVTKNHLEAVHNGKERYAIDRWSIQSFEQAEFLAAACNFNERAVVYIPVDKGPHTAPRFDVIKAPVLGDPVSKGFNGDYYPCGNIKTISKSLRRVETTDGTVFYRKRLTAAWVDGGTWSMVAGHINERNPSF